MTEIVKLDPAEYGLEESKAKQIANQFKPMLEKMQTLEIEFNQVQKMEMSPEKVKAAKELRLKYVKVRTGTASIHKEQKAFYLAGGRYVDGWKNAQIFASQGIEEKLSDIENHFAKIEAEKIESLRKERWAKLAKYMEQQPEMLGVMEQDVFDNLLSGSKAAHEARVAAEKKAEEERLEAERIEKLIRDRERLIAPVYSFFEVPAMQILGELSEDEFQLKLDEAKVALDEDELKKEKQRKENERLKKEAEAREKAIAEEKKKREAEAEKERKKQDAKLKAERKAREKAEAEIKARKEAEEKERKKAELEARKLAKAPIKKQLNNWVDSLELPNLNTSNISDLDNELAESIANKFDGFKKWAYNQIENY